MQGKMKKQSGFTIIEIMIVLAIAGLILLIVFLAVPALQRNARNTSRKNDVGNFGSAVATWISNNNGSLPGTITTGSSSSCSTDLQSIADTIKLGFYSKSNITCAGDSTAADTGVSVCTTGGSSCGSNAAVGTENVIMDEGVVCNSPLTPGMTSPIVTTSGASSRSYVFLYEVETGGEPQPECSGG